MKIIEETQSRRTPFDAHPSDFNFVHDVIEALERLPSKDRVCFPLPNRGSVFADIECKLSYDSDYKPSGEFFFVHDQQMMTMGHTAVVRTLVENGILKLHLQIKPNRKLQASGHRSVTRVVADAKAMAAMICSYYAVGAVGRKVISMPSKKQTA